MVSCGAKRSTPRLSHPDLRCQEKNANFAELQAQPNKKRRNNSRKLRKECKITTKYRSFGIGPSSGTALGPAAEFNRSLGALGAARGWISKRRRGRCSWSPGAAVVVNNPTTAVVE
jgi:hypothetical protein